MSRQEQDREDLLREATALVQRIELRIRGEAEPVILGFRRNGSGSVFLSPQRVYQFNTELELRRAYVDDLLFKSEQRRLFELRRERTDETTLLVRRELSDLEQASFLATAQAALIALRSRLEANEFEVLGQVPAEEPMITRIIDWLNSLPMPVVIANLPNA